MLNHSRFPGGMPLPSMPAQSSRRARGAPTARFAVRLRVALRFAQQPTGLTLPFGALMISLPLQISAFCALAARSPCICSRLQVALAPSGPSAHRAHAFFRRTCGSLCRLWRQQSTGLTLPSGAPKPYAAAFFASIASARRAQETRISPTSGVFQRSVAPRCAARRQVTFPAVPPSPWRG